MEVHHIGIMPGRAVVAMLHKIGKKSEKIRKNGKINLAKKKQKNIDIN